MIKVLEIQARVGFGGSEVHTYILSERLSRNKKYEVVVVCPLSEGRFQTNLTRMGIKVYNLDMKRFKRVFSDLVRLIIIIKKEKIDIIHSHLRRADILAAIAGKVTNTPVLVTLHGQTRDLLKKKKVLKDTILKQLHICCLKYCTREIIAISNFVKELNVKDLGLDAEKIKVIHNCTDIDRFNIKLKKEDFKREIGLLNNKKLVAFVGRFDEQKRPFYFLEVARDVLFGRDDVEFMIIGKGRLKYELEKYVLQNHLQKNVRFFGTRMDMEKIINVIDILLITAINEGFGRTITEAMACGKPVIAFNAGAAAEIIVNNRTGYIVEDSNITDMGNCVNDILDNTQKAERMGEYAKERVKKYFSTEVFMRKTEKVVESMGN